MKSFFCLVLILCAVWARGNDVAIVVGVSDYAALDSNGDLKYADEDARLFAKTIEKQLRFAKNDIIVLTSKPRSGERLSTAANILAAFDELPKMMKEATGSRFFFYYSGHGLNSSEFGPYLAAQDFDPKDLLSGRAAELTAGKLSDRLSSINTRFTMAVYDMCRPRLANSLDASKQTNRQFGIQKKNAQSVAMIFAANEGSSFEDEKFKHGLFTYYFCKGLTPEPTLTLPVVRAMNDKGEVTLDGLQRYVTREVAKASPNSIQASKGGRDTGVAGIGPLPDFVGGPKEMSSPLVVFPRDSYRPEILPVQKYDVFVESALEYYSRKDFANAARDFVKASAVKAFGDRRDAWSAFAAGICFFQVGQSRDAEKQYLAAIDADPRNSRAMNNLGILLKRRGLLDEADYWYRKAIEFDPTYAMAIYNKAILEEFYVTDETWTVPESYYRAAIAADPTFAPAMNNLGLRLQNKGKLEEADSQFRAAITADPKFATAMNNLGNLLRKMGEQIGAEAQYRAAIAADPTSALARSNLGLLFQSTGDFKKAEAQFRDAIDADPQFAPAMNNFGFLLQNANELEQAEVQYRAAIAADPKFALAMNNLGNLLQNKGQLAEAEAQYRAAIAANSRFSLAKKNLGNLLKQKGELKGAEAQYKAAIYAEPISKAMPRGDDLRLNRVAELLKADEVAEQYQNSITVKPDVALMRADLAELLLQQGKKEEAFKEAKEARRLGLKAHPVYKKLGIDKR